jgi:isoquinoline 1-oxidoreductase beta subunit
MLYAMIARCPTFGGRPARFDAAKAKSVFGVRDVFEIPALGKGMFTAGGVVVIADSTWSAMKGREALDITWDRGPAASENSASMYEQLRAAANKAGKRVRNDGDVDRVLSNGAKKIEALYELPLLAHATMEPMNITAHVRAGEAEVWAPTQSPDWVQATVAQVLGLKPDKVIVHSHLSGRRFRASLHGRLSRRNRANRESSQEARAVGLVARR